jgi:hypothetical protein
VVKNVRKSGNKKRLLGEEKEIGDNKPLFVMFQSLFAKSVESLRIFALKTSILT